MFSYTTAYEKGFSTPTTDKKRAGEQSLRPITIKQLLSAHFDTDCWKIDQIEVSQLSVVGRINKVVPGSTHTRYTIDDGTASVDVSKWVDADTHDEMDSRSNTYPEGMYVKAVGTPKDFKGQVSFTAAHIQPLQSPDMITYHLLEAISVYLEFTRGPAKPGQNKPMIPPPTNQSSFDRFEANDALGRLENEVVRYLSQLPSLGDEGIAVKDICYSLRSVAAEASIRNAIEHLKVEGHVYETSDMEHIMLAM